MTAFQDSFQAEVARLVRKQVKDDQAALKKSDRAQRSEVANLKQEVKALSGQVRSLTKQLEKLAKWVEGQQPVKEPREPRTSSSAAFDHQALIFKRKDLGLTQQQMAQLLGASSISVYKWESGSVQPRAKQLERIQAVLKMGKRQALKQFSEAAAE